MATESCFLTASALEDKPHFVNRSRLRSLYHGLGRLRRKWGAGAGERLRRKPDSIELICLAGRVRIQALHDATASGNIATRERPHAAAQSACCLHVITQTKQRSETNQRVRAGEREVRDQRRRIRRKFVRADVGACAARTAGRVEIIRHCGERRRFINGVGCGRQQMQVSVGRD